MGRNEFPTDYYSRARDDLFGLIPKTPGLKVLEFGCGEGRLGARLKEFGRIVYGVERNFLAANAAKSILDRVYIGDIENIEFDVSDGFFDIIILGDVLEHLVDPWKLLHRIKRYLAKDGIIISSIPNLQYFPVLINLIRGRFEYKAHGILDKTHLRFFTAAEARRLFSGAGYKIISNPRIFPYKKRWAKGLATALELLSFRLLRNYLVGQIYIIAKKSS